jgi:hypothetical protein
MGIAEGWAAGWIVLLLKRPGRKVLRPVLTEPARSVFCSCNQPFAAAAQNGK